MAAIAPALVTAAAAYTVDFHVVPTRLTPSFERRLSKRSILPRQRAELVRQAVLERGNLSLVDDATI